MAIWQSHGGVARNHPKLDHELKPMVTWGSPTAGQDLAVSLAQIGGNRETGSMTRQGHGAMAPCRDHRRDLQIIKDPKNDPTIGYLTYSEIIKSWIFMDII